MVRFSADIFSTGSIPGVVLESVKSGIIRYGEILGVFLYIVTLSCTVDRIRQRFGHS